MYFDPVLIGMVVFLLVFAGIAVSGYCLGLHITGDLRKARLRLRGLGVAAPLPIRLARKSELVLKALSKLIVSVGKRQLKQAALRTSLQRAGYVHPNAPVVFLGAKALLVLTLTLGGALTGYWTLPPKSLYGASTWKRLGAWSFVGLATGILVPTFWLSDQVRKRQRILRNAMPDALDMLVLCLEGGVSFNAAMQRVTDELQIAHPVLSGELNIVQREMMLGLSVGGALRKFADRCDLSEVRDLAIVLNQSERIGAGLTKVLARYAENTRITRQQQAEEQAQKTAVKILFPTLLCIFPAIFIVVIGPAVPDLARLFSR